MANITNFDEKMFAAAAKEAEKSDFENFHMGCVIVYKKHIFEHEHRHLCKDLFIFFYVDKYFEINTPSR